MKIKNIKQFNGLRALFSIAALMVVFTVFNIDSAYAQQPEASPTATPAPEPTPYKKARKHSDKDLEDLRGKITDVFLTVEDASNTIIPDNPNAKKRMKEAKDKLAVFSLDDLDQLRDSLDPAEMDADLQDAKDKLAKVKPTMQAAYAQLYSESSKVGRDGDSSGDFSSLSSLPGIENPNAVCEALIGTGKAQLHVLAAAKAAYIAAKILSIALDRGCNQIIVAGVVVLGNGGVGGGNSSLACIISDGLLLVADTLQTQVAYCDTDFTRRSVDTAVARMATVHGDLANSVANDNTNAMTITGTVDTAKTFIDGKATTNKDTIVSAIGSGTTTITTAVGDGTSTIVNNAKATKDFLLRAQIEADLSSTDSATFVAMYLTPASVCSPVLNDKGESVTGATQCGYLNFARAIVVQTITNLGGANTAQANAFVAKGDTYVLVKDYRQAYQNYRLAYKTAAGISTK